MNKIYLNIIFALIAAAIGVGQWNLETLKRDVVSSFSIVGESLNLLEARQDSILGSLAPAPGATTEGTSTAGWTDDGSVVRLNTAADNVGIGTVSPGAKLHVIGAGIFSGNLSANGTLSINGGTFSFGQGTATSTLTVDSDGDLGVGTTSPARTFSVHGQVYVAGTTTTGVLNVASSTTQINTVRYTWPSSQGGASTRLENDGSGNLSWTAATVGNASSTVFTTTGSSTWAVPSGVTRAKFTLIGGGGGGGGAGGGTGAGGGGGGGATAIVWLNVSSSVGIFVGHAGQGGPAGAAGVTGSTTRACVSTFCVDSGGGVAGSGGNGSFGAGGAGGTVTSSATTTVSIAGEAGQAGTDNWIGTTDIGGEGGNSTYGVGGRIQTITNSNGIAGSGYGAGGGGAVYSSGGGQTGAAGTAGLVIIEWIES